MFLQSRRVQVLVVSGRRVQVLVASGKWGSSGSWGRAVQHITRPFLSKDQLAPNLQLRPNAVTGSLQVNALRCWVLRMRGFPWSPILLLSKLGISDRYKVSFCCQSLPYHRTRSGSTAQHTQCHTDGAHPAHRFVFITQPRLHLIGQLFNRKRRWTGCMDSGCYAHPR